MNTEWTKERIASALRLLSASKFDADVPSGRASIARHRALRTQLLSAVREIERLEKKVADLIESGKKWTPGFSATDIGDCQQFTEVSNEQATPEEEA
jgi:hypothetical protein